MRHREPKIACCIRRRLFRFLLHKLRWHPSEWRIYGGDLRHMALGVSVTLDGRVVRYDANACLFSLAVPLWWRGRLRRSARRVAWQFLASKIL